MSKIYSRPRIKLPVLFENNNKENNKNKRLLKIIIIIIIAISTAKMTLDAILPIYDELCKDKAKTIATIVTNEEATNVMREHTYEELFSIEKDNNGNITMIKSNVSPINEIISDVAIKIQEGINNKGKNNVSIPLGSFTGFKLLSGEGPSIKLEISLIGNVETDLRSEFTAQGINQTLHRVYLQVKCQIIVLTPFDSITVDIVNQVLLVENVIVGNIPNTYYNLQGLNKDNMVDIIE